MQNKFQKKNNTGSFVSSSSKIAHFCIRFY